jgi:uncharacterized repeat protein (TIGR03843 family)
MARHDDHEFEESDGFDEDLVFDDDFEDDELDELDEDEGSATSLDELLDSTLDVEDPAVLPLLTNGEIELVGRMPWSSNQTFLVNVRDERHHGQAVYKPQRGERPLWDFPPGLWRREVATYLLARRLGWCVVPPTVARTADVPFGEGSLQFLVIADYAQHYFTLRDDPGHRRSLEQLCVLDLLANNTDRKGGHVLVDERGRIWGVDHGLNFAAEFKLRTVMWDFAGDPVPASLADDVVRLIDEGIDEELAALLDPFERDALLTRARAVVSSGRFPHDPTGRRHPWPLV